LSRIRLEIESELQSVGLMAMAVNRICAFCGMNEVEAYQVELCVSEAATNAILHAYDGCPGHEVSLLVSVGKESLLLECADTGKPMAPEHVTRVTVHSPDLETDETSLREGGRGLLIIRGVMDEVSYVTNDTSNCLRMTKRFKKSSSLI
jgi:anti-sigma regulatory factor (Ser/Thr protein kinase)